WRTIARIPSCRDLLAEVLSTHPRTALGMFELIADTRQVANFPRGSLFRSKVRAPSAVFSSFVIPVGVGNHPLLHAVNTHRTLRNFGYASLGCVTLPRCVSLPYRIAPGLDAESYAGACHQTTDGCQQRRDEAFAFTS